MTIPLGAPSDEDKRMYELTQRSSGVVPRLETGEETQVGLVSKRKWDWRRAEAPTRIDARDV